MEVNSLRKMYSYIK